MSRHQIDYESLAQDAMRGLVRAVLQRVARSGLPGDHHFYISFHTRAPGVALSKRLLERYPDEMTIVLQNKFSDLKALDERFEVTLWFDSIAERLSVPFAAIKVFFDPSVPFGHQFEVAETQHGASHAPVLLDRRDGGRTHADRSTDAGGGGSGPKPASIAPMKGDVPRSPSRPAAPSTQAPPPPSIGSAKPATEPKGASPAPKAATPRPAPAPSASPAQPPKEPPPAKLAESSGAQAAPPAEAPSTETERGDSGKVVPLDAFRKKN